VNSYLLIWNPKKLLWYRLQEQFSSIELLYFDIIPKITTSQRHHAWNFGLKHKFAWCASNFIMIIVTPIDEDFWRLNTIKTNYFWNHHPVCLVPSQTITVALLSWYWRQSITINSFSNHKYYFALTTTSITYHKIVWLPSLQISF
jgi:hypothetical protein